MKAQVVPTPMEQVQELPRAEVTQQRSTEMEAEAGLRSISLIRAEMGNRIGPEFMQESATGEMGPEDDLLPE